jgi:integrase
MIKPFSGTIQDELKRLDKEPFDKRIKEEIKRFTQELGIRENISEIRRYFYIQRLRKLAELIPNNFLDPKKKDIDKILESLYNGPRVYKDWTIKNYITMLKKFYKWHYKTKGTALPEYISDLNVKMKNNTKTPEDLITKDEITSLIANSRNARDKALFSVLYDSGCRLGEIINMRIKDLSFDEFGAVLKVTGKTGFRQVRIVGNSIAYLRAWLDNHPQKNNLNAYLFCNLSEKILGRNLTYSDVYSIFKKTAKRSGIKKRIHPHLFRHTRATILASKVTEAPLESQMGWVHGSKQTRTYVHLSLRDQDNAILKAYGIKVNEDETIKEDRPKECPRCHALNPSDAQYCRNCWMPFDIGTALEIEAKEKKVTEALIQSGVIDNIMVEVLKSIPESSRLQVLVTALENVVKEPEKKEKVKMQLAKLLGNEGT